MTNTEGAHLVQKEREQVNGQSSLKQPALGFNCMVVEVLTIYAS